MNTVGSKRSLKDFMPKSIQCLKGYSFKTFTTDTSAAVIVALAGLPLAMGYAIAAGFSPHIGILCTIVAGLFSALLGGSRVLISGPAPGFEAIILTTVAAYGMDGMFTSIVLAGSILILLGVAGLGSIVKYIPRPIILGVSNGIGLFLIINQLKSFLGLNIPNWVKLNSFLKLQAAVIHLPTLVPATAIFGFLSLVGLIYCQTKIKNKMIPAALLVTIACSVLAIVVGVSGGLVPTIGSTYEGGIPRGFVVGTLPTFRLGLVPDLLSTAITIAMIVAQKTLVTAVISDRMLKDRHNPNMELIAQGVGNMASGLVGGMPSMAAISRSVNNVRFGGRTPIAGVMVSMILLLIVLVAAPLTNHIPLTMLAAIIIMVGYTMGNWHEIPQILKMPKADIAVWMVTFTLTAAGDIDLALKIGFLLAIAFYVQKVAATTHVKEEDFDHKLGIDANPLSLPVPTKRPVIGNGLIDPEKTTAKIYAITGPFLFGTTDKLSLLSDEPEKLPSIVILNLSGMTAIDATGVQELENFARLMKECKKELVLFGLKGQPCKLLQNTNFANYVGHENQLASLAEALSRVHHIEKEALSLSVPPIIESCVQVLR